MASASARQLAPPSETKLSMPLPPSMSVCQPCPMPICAQAASSAPAASASASASAKVIGFVFFMLSPGGGGIPQGDGGAVNGAKPDPGAGCPIQPEVKLQAASSQLASRSRP